MTAERINPIERETALIARMLNLWERIGGIISEQKRDPRINDYPRQSYLLGGKIFTLFFELDNPDEVKKIKAEHAVSSKEEILKIIENGISYTLEQEEVLFRGIAAVSIHENSQDGSLTRRDIVIYRLGKQGITYGVFEKGIRKLYGDGTLDPNAVLVIPDMSQPYDYYQQALGGGLRAIREEEIKEVEAAVNAIDQKVMRN